MSWYNPIDLDSKNYICGHCGKDINSAKGYYHDDRHQYIYLCHCCGKPTYFGHNEQVPGPLIGDVLKNVPKDPELLYDEARRSFSVGAFTASVMACRKIIMHIAVAEGAAQGLKFIEYVEYLDSQHFIPPKGKEWVDHIRTKGNEANHEITIMEQNDAEDLIIFIEGLLRFIYEFPSRVKQKANPPKSP